MVRESSPLKWSDHFHFEIIIIITTLLQEDNIFGMYACLIYGPQLQSRHVIDN